jgi:hypothetical protein
VSDDIGFSESEALHRAGDPDHVLSGEDETGTADAFEWLAVYTELLVFKHRLIEQANAPTPSMSSAGRDSITGEVDLLTCQADRYRERLRYWQGVVTMTGGIAPATPVLRGSAEALTKTERAPAPKNSGVAPDPENLVLHYLAGHAETSTERDYAAGKLARRVAYRAKAVQEREPLRLECLQSLVSTPGLVGNLKKYARGELKRLGIPPRMESS